MADSPSSAESQPVSTAGRIAGWTGNLIVSALVVLACLVFGRDTIRWWREEPDDAALELAALAEGLGDPQREHVIQFGDLPWTLHRVPIDGPREAALAALARQTERLTRSAPPPATHATQAERELLAGLAARAPQAGGREGWRVDAVEGQLPILVGSKEIEASAARIASSERRVVTWAVAMPKSERQWTLCIFRPLAEGTAGSPRAAPVPLPPESQRTLAVYLEGGTAAVGFRGAYRPRTWQSHYDDWFRSHGWETTVPWRKGRASWSARFTIRRADGRETADVHFSVSNPGHLSGLLLWSRTDDTSGSHHP